MTVNNVTKPLNVHMHKNLNAIIEIKGEQYKTKVCGISHGYVRNLISCLMQ